MREQAKELLKKAEWREKVIEEAEMHLKSVSKSLNMGQMISGPETRRMKIAKSRTAKIRHPVSQALYDANLTPQQAAEICGTTRDILKKSWAKEDQFREIRPEWRDKLATRGVPPSVWPKKG